ncbi:hypothetical protein PoB_004030800 [Plakobranchus ocellatus]|uniref:Uncharacterized protein n=1 Tax=Plakobranchus ocellatus TaxID=259542 RepID=A0AAV4B3W8_9GAST|nr:hypothetical protein PoB_004030800 [Plakobranchus ocellatus]
MVFSDFQALRQAREPATGLEPSIEEFLQILRRTRHPLCHRRLQTSKVTRYYKTITCTRVLNRKMQPYWYIIPFKKIRSVDQNFVQSQPLTHRSQLYELRVLLFLSL